MDKKNSSPFCCTDGFPSVDITEEEYVHYMEVESVSSDYDPNKPSEFLIEKSVEEYERIPIREFIASFSSKVGLKNELKGIVSKKQMDDYIMAHKAAPGFVDLTALPDSQFEMKEYVSKLDEYWAQIPDELKNGLTKEEFIKTMNAEKLKNYVISEVSKKTTSEVKKEGE